MSNCSEHKKELLAQLNHEGYTDIVDLPNRGFCGIFRFIFTVGLCYGLNEYAYKGRYCFESMADAREALRDWDGEGDPPGNWIKHKGKVEYSNPNYIP